MALNILGFSQGLISNSSNSFPQCGSFEYMKSQDQHNPGFLDASNENLKQMSARAAMLGKKGDDEILTVEVVFHVVYNSEEENVPDSVLYNQLRILNECYRRQNADTVDLRSEFSGMAGDSRIEFVLASTDPNGKPTNGITRTHTDVEYFGGILPYEKGQTTEINTWVQDSLFSNMGRLSHSSSGGTDPWNTDKYLNIWIGDMRIFEPKVDNFEEMVFFALATPPANHPSWSNYPQLGEYLSTFEDGVYIHYTVPGPNNPVAIPSPYDVYNGLVTEGKTLVHEVGHYLGLRHLWGDGDCSMDDFIDDTPKGASSSSYGCSKTKNSCTDTINGKDLPDMIENYMDYSSSSCQNSFTKQQIAVMRQVVRMGRGWFASVPSVNDIDQNIKIFPNPAKNELNIHVQQSANTGFSVMIYDVAGSLILNATSANNDLILTLDLKPGMYTVLINSGNTQISKKLVVLE